MRSSNPALRTSALESLGTHAEPMTVTGTIHKTGLLVLLALLSAGWVWSKFWAEGAEAVGPWILGGAIGGFVVAIVTVFKKTLARFTAPVYALLEGLFLGGISARYEAAFSGITIQAAALTFMTLIAMLTAYRTGAVKVTERFRAGVFAATGGIALVYLATMVLGFFGVRVPFIHESGLLGIGFSLFVVVIAALNLVLDFDFIERGAAQGAPRYMEWYGAFGLMVTLVWLYLEALRLIAKLRSR
jgi:uncharacterized YccA/Bax inhibitor family protein